MKKKMIAAACSVLILILAGCGGGSAANSEETTAQAAGNTANRGGGQAPGVSEVLEAGMEEADAKADSTPVFWDGEEGDARQSGLTEGAPAPKEVSAADSADGVGSQSDTGAAASEMPAAEGIDVDLTALSATMVYSEVYNMMVAPEDYIGKSIKMKGSFNIYRDEAAGNTYYSCVIRDATACCAQGIEFVLTDDYTYPDDYPEEGGDITVVGRFDTYREGEYTYCTLRDAELA